MDKKYFPIKTETACQLKWNWSTIRLYAGNTSSCHRVQADMIDPDNFDQFHNTPKKIADRNLMLQGQWPTGGCEYCRNIESAGGTSDRMFHLNMPDQVPEQLNYDLTATAVDPAIVEVYLDNVCNMKCIYCYDGFSSQIQHENNRFGRFEKNGVIIENYAKKTVNQTELTDKFWNWLRHNGHKIKRLHILGGEPLYQPQIETCFEILESNHWPQLEFNIVSNLMIRDSYFEKSIARIKNIVQQRRIARFDLTASIDCWGPEQEYVRYGLNLEQWKKNFEHVISQVWIYLTINHTITGLTIKTLPDLLKYIEELRLQFPRRKINQHFSTVIGPTDYLHPEIFGSGYFDKDFEHILSLMPDHNSWNTLTRNYMLGIQKQINSGVRRPEKILQLTTFLDEIDRRRGLNWRQTFPWLDKETTDVV